MILQRLQSQPSPGPHGDDITSKPEQRLSMYSEGRARPYSIHEDYDDTIPLNDTAIKEQNPLKKVCTQFPRHAYVYIATVCTYICIYVYIIYIPFIQ